MTHPVPTRRSSDLICNGDRYVREGKWLQQRMPLTRAIRGRRLGILGLGRIGREIARKAAVFDMEIAYHGRSKQEIGRAHVCTPVTNAHLVCRLLLEKQNTTN